MIGGRRGAEIGAMDGMMIGGLDRGLGMGMGMGMLACGCVGARLFTSCCVASYDAERVGARARARLFASWACRIR